MRRLLVIATVALLVGCQQPPTPGPTPPGSSAQELRAEGDALAARGEYQGAAAKYQAALGQEPNDVSLRFALGTALSHLGRRQETIEQFRFVVARGQPDSPEVHAARRWLVAAGELAGTVTFGSSTSPEPEASPAPAAAPAPASSPTGAQSPRVRVRTEPRPGTGEVIVVLLDPERVFTMERTGKLGEAFEFANVAPGTYRLIAREQESGRELWNQEVTVAPGKDLVLELK